MANQVVLRGTPPMSGRSLRVAAGVAAIWVLNAMDLVLTQEAASRGNFAEANLIAAPWIASPWLLTTYKATLVLAGTAILLRFRHHRSAEPACVLMVAVYTGVLYVWSLYHQYLQICLSDPATVRPPLML